MPFAEHGATASEPFAVSGAYINRMTDDGSPCTRDVLAMVGDRSAALHAQATAFLHATDSAAIV